MPVGGPFGGGFLEDEAALGTDNVVAEAEGFVEEHGAFGNVLEAIAALFLVRGWRGGG